MRLKNVPGSREAIEESEYVIKKEAAPKGRWRDIFKEKAFGNDVLKDSLTDVYAGENKNVHTELHIEIGMGKGAFLMEKAMRSPDVFFVGVEKFSSVLVRAIEKQNEKKLPNLLFIRMEAEYIGDWFDKDEADRIYLNFSDPWPKDRHAKRRLTSRQFLEKYKEILLPEGQIEFKTDNWDLFNFSLEEIDAAAWKLLKCTYDLHNSPMNENNIMTEYEKKFSGEGKKICCFFAENPKSS